MDSRFWALLGLLDLGAAWAGNSDTEILKAADFEVDTAPFFACTYKDPSYANAEDGRLVTYFDEANYDGTRTDRGVEICASDFPGVKKELWHGFSVNVPADYPSNKQSIISQHFCLGGCASHCGILHMVDNRLDIEYRTACVDPTVATLVEDISRDTWHPIVLNARFSNSGDGHYVVWYDGEEVYNVQNINLGFDSSWTDDGQMTTGVGFKNGQYNASTYSF